MHKDNVKMDHRGDVNAGVGHGRLRNPDGKERKVMLHYCPPFSRLFPASGVEGVTLPHCCSEEEYGILLFAPLYRDAFGKSNFAWQVRG